jgi:hypothetical protein
LLILINIFIKVDAVITALDDVLVCLSASVIAAILVYKLSAEEIVLSVLFKAALL